MDPSCCSPVSDPPKTIQHQLLSMLDIEAIDCTIRGTRPLPTIPRLLRTITCYICYMLVILLAGMVLRSKLGQQNSRRQAEQS